MSQALFDDGAGGRHEADLAGSSSPGERARTQVVDVLDELEQ